MTALEKLLTIYRNKQLDNIDININILKPGSEKMEISVSNKITKGSLRLKDHKFYLSIPKLNYDSPVCIEYIDFDMMELVDVSKLPRKLLVFDIELPVPF